jgi:SAM-dependent methyltransferase
MRTQPTLPNIKVQDAPPFVVPFTPSAMSEFNTDDRDTSGWSANAYQSAAHFVYSAENTEPVLSMLNAQAGEKIVDFGCGSGEVTHQIIRAVGEEGEVVGIDISQAMVRSPLIFFMLPRSLITTVRLRSRRQSVRRICQARICS